MTKNKILNNYRPPAWVVAVLLVLVCVGQGDSARHDPCFPPPLVGSSTKPNVMIVFDYSGSMQQSAYLGESYQNQYSSKVMRSTSNPRSVSYDPEETYYGMFESDKYYYYDKAHRYWREIDPASYPVQEFTITRSRKDSATGAVWLEAPGHNFTDTGDDIVAVYGLKGDDDLNGDAFEVLEVSGDEFRIGATWTPTEDSLDQGSAVAKRRVIGSASDYAVNGLSGDFLNMYTTSRVDASYKALFHCPEREAYDASGNPVYFDADGNAVDASGNPSEVDHYVIYSLAARSFARDTAHGTTTYTRMATDDYDTSTMQSDPPSDGYDFPNDFYYGDYKDKTKYLSIMQHHTGVINADDARYWSSTAMMEQWVMELDEPTHVCLWWQSDLSGTYVKIYSQPIPHEPGAHSNEANLVVNSISLGTNNGINTWYDDHDIELPAGTYYLRIYRYDGGFTPNPYTLASNVELRPIQPSDNPANYTADHFANVGQVDPNAVGAIDSTRLALRIPAAERRGIIQKNFANVRFGLMGFTTRNSPDGKIYIGCQNENMHELIQAFTSTISDGSTPAGPALEEVEDYFKQTTGLEGSNETDFLGPKLAPGDLDTATEAQLDLMERDPYYRRADNTYVPCRNSYALLFTDGEWNSGGDPADYALSMHVNDMRPDIGTPGEADEYQYATTYSIFAFSSDIKGLRAMATTGMNGGFENVCAEDDKDVGGYCTTSPCGPLDEPYDYSSGDSRYVSWPRPHCDPGGTYVPGQDLDGDGIDDIPSCCTEWDEDGDGWPDKFFYASDGRKLVKALTAVLAGITSGNSAAGAVATVSQQSRFADIVIRGVFETSDEEDPTKFKWYGHLEAYWPDPDDGWYDFELDVDSTDPNMPGGLGGKCKPGLLCSEIPNECGRQNCYDCGEILAATTPGTRDIFTMVNDVQVDFTDANVTFSTLEVADNTEAGNLINWTRGLSVTGLRDRQGSVLGDIVYSTPVIVDVPNPATISLRDPNHAEYVAAAYQRAQEADRLRMVYVGANDGMLHAFVIGVKVGGVWKTKPSEDSRVGQELWAYIPSSVLPRLQDLARKNYYARVGDANCEHLAMVDLSPRAWEVYFDPTGGSAPEWRTVLLGGQRGGGDVYFAVDITDPRNPVVLWEYSVLKNLAVAYNDGANKIGLPFANDGVYAAMRDLPLSWSEPYVARLQASGLDFYRAYIDSVGALAVATESTDTAHVALIGGGFRSYDPLEDIPSSLPGYPDRGQAGRSDIDEALRMPNLLALDIATGVNLFQCVWPIVAQHRPSGWWEESDVRYASDAITPYAMQAGTAFDYFYPEYDDGSGNPVSASIIDDGFIDRFYVGDIAGLFYSFKFESGVTFASSVDGLGVRVQVRETKPGDPWNNQYRGNRQPVSARPSVSIGDPGGSTTDCPSNLQDLRIVFGTGKYDDVVYGDNDKSDTARMAYYNLKDTIDIAGLGLAPAGTTVTINGDGTYTGTPSGATSLFEFQIGNMYFEFNRPCPSPSFNNVGTCEFTIVDVDGNGEGDNPSTPNVNEGADDRLEPINCCEWSTDVTGECGDCCESSCSTACWDCVLDFPGEGERVMGQGLIAGGFVFFTTFQPIDDPCKGGGRGYLYILDFQCQNLQEGVPDVVDVGLSGMNYLGDSGGNFGYRVNLFSEGEYPGAPSSPVLDSSGNHVIIQMSDGTLLRIAVDLYRDSANVNWIEIEQ